MDTAEKKKKLRMLDACLELTEKYYVSLVPGQLETILLVCEKHGLIKEAT